MQSRIWKLVILVLLIAAGRSMSNAQTLVLPTTYACLGEPLTFIPDSVNHSSYYLWVFGDGDHVNDSIGYHTYTQPGEYLVTLYTTTYSECGYSASQTVIVSGLHIDSTVTHPNPCGASQSAEVFASGGVGNYTYAWSNGQSGPLLVGAMPGGYAVTVTDIAGCSSIGFVMVSGSAVLSISTRVMSNVNCINGNDGAIQSQVNGGTAPFTYLWSNGSVSSGIANLSAGTYCLTVTDANGCTAATCAAVSVLPDLSPPTIVCPANLAIAGNASQGPCTGIAQYATPIGTDNCPGATTVLSAGLASGSAFPQGSHVVTYTVTDAAGNTGSCSFTVTVGGCNVAPIAVCQNLTVNANGSCQGMATAVQFDGGSTDPNGDALTFNVSPAAPYPLGTTNVTLQVSDGSHVTTCVATITVVDVTPPSIQCPTNLNVAAANGQCSRLVNYQATTSDNCVAAITYSQMPGSVFAIGTTNVVATATDLAGNASTCSFTVTVTGNPLTLALTSPLIACGYQVSACCVNGNVGNNGSCGHDGGIQSTVVGGCAPYVYHWSTGQTAANLSGLVAGTYTITVTDANGATAVQSITLQQAPVLALATTVQAATCAQGGSIATTVTGGCGPYQYLWANGSTAANLTGLGAGSYCLSLTDATGCQIIRCVQVSGSTSMSNVIQGTAAGCNGNNGTISFQVSGGLSPYTYHWADGPTTQNRSNLAAGTYCITATDAGGCTTSACYTVAASNAVVANAGTDKCVLYGYGTTNCIQILGSQSGGTAPYTLRWRSGSNAGPIVGTTSSLTVCPTTTTTYCYTAIDANGCSSTDCMVVNVTDIRCGNNNSKVTICHFPPGNPGNPQTLCIAASAVPTHIPAHGNDYLGPCGLSTPCSNAPARMNPTELDPKSPLTMTVTARDVKCFGGADGAVAAIVSGGTAPYEISWSNGSSMDSIQGLTKGTYSVTVTDAAGNRVHENALVKQPDPVDVVPAYGDGSCDGRHLEVALTIDGPAAPYGVTWPDGQVGPIASQVASGVQLIAITDKLGCVNTQILEVPVKEPFAVNAGHDRVVFPTIRNKECTKLTAQPLNGQGPYSYFWSDASSGVSDAICPAQTVEMSVMVIDGRGCAASDTVLVVAMPAATSAEATSLMCDAFGNTMEVHPLQIEEMMQLGWRYGPCSEPTSAASLDDDEVTKQAPCLLNVSPNPFSSKANVRFSIPSDMFAKLYLTSMTGVVVSVLYAGEETVAVDKELVLERRGLASGTYLLRLVSQRGIECTIKVVIIN